MSQQNRITLTTALRRPTTLIALAMLLLVALVWGVALVRAAQPKTLDERTYSVASQLQCPICHGESVADSPSPLAQEMRSLIREQLAEGHSQQYVIQYFHQRYGDAILESPPTSGFTLLIWLGPIVALLAGALFLFSLAREWRSAQPTLLAPAADPAILDDEMTPDERSAYLALLRRELADDEGLPATAASASATPRSQPGDHQ